LDAQPAPVTVSVNLIFLGFPMGVFLVLSWTKKNKFHVFRCHCFDVHKFKRTLSVLMNSIGRFLLQTIDGFGPQLRLSEPVSVN
jgi:hypothetical protein